MNVWQKDQLINFEHQFIPDSAKLFTLCIDHLSKLSDSLLMKSVELARSQLSRIRVAATNGSAFTFGPLAAHAEGGLSNYHWFE